MNSKLVTLYHTIKYLKPVQFSNRLSRKFNKPKKIEVFSAVSQAKRFKHNPLLVSSYTSKNTFTFLNVSDVITDWNDVRKAKLWLYNLHYFDDLNQNGFADRKSIHRELINTWIDENPFMYGNGWEPYPMSLRVVNWIKWFLVGNNPDVKWLESLTQQVGALSQQLEYHLLGNHLFANAKALVFAGCYFEGSQAEKWLKDGLKILSKEIPEQILSDGGNFELSPMYHNIILADMLDLYNLAKAYPGSIDKAIADNWETIIIKMLNWAKAMSHQDGDVSFFNDSALGIAASVTKLSDYAYKLGISHNPDVAEKNNCVDLQLTNLAESGYLVVENKSFKFLFDVAKVGPDYIPGHAHADTLSFEMSLFGHRLFVNSGTSLYGYCEERLRQRKTESHNTVVVNSKDSSEVWGGFRVAKRAYPKNLSVAENTNNVRVSCEHTGYSSLGIIHKREINFKHSEISITDSLQGKKAESSITAFHLHPDVTIADSSPNELTLRMPEGQLVKVISEDVISIEDTTWHPEFGKVIANKKLIFKFKGNIVNTVITWEKV